MDSCGDNTAKLRRASLQEVEVGSDVHQSTTPFDLDFGLASPLKHPETFGYDDPVMFPGVQGTDSNAFSNETGFQFALGSSDGLPVLDSSGFNNNTWNMPGAYSTAEDVADMELDSPDYGVDIVPTSNDISHMGFPNSTVSNGDPDYGTVGGMNFADYAKLQYPVPESLPFTSIPDGMVLDPAHETRIKSENVVDEFPAFTDFHAGMDPGMEVNTPQNYDADSIRPGSFVSEDYSPGQGRSFSYRHGQNLTPEPFNLRSRSNTLQSIYRSASEFSGYDAENSYGGSIHVNHRDSHYEDANGYPSGRGQYIALDTKDNVSHHTSISAVANELSPLTATTSFTPSVTSLHSAQPSYFSAQQFLRSSIDQPPALVSRASVDIYSRRRPSIESIQSGSYNVPARSQRSLSSYFHFRDRDRDRDHHSPLPMSRADSPASSEWLQTPPNFQLTQNHAQNPTQHPRSVQPRHSIRSIFKTNSTLPVSLNAHDINAASAENEAVSASVAAPNADEPLEADIEGSVAKKNKRSKRNLFTRFKATKPSDSVEVKQEQGLDTVRSANASDGEKDSTKISDIQPPTSGMSSRGTATSLSKVDSVGSATGDTQEPDYASLFTGVGKRRNIVGMKGRKKSDPSLEKEVMVKVESDAEKALMAASLSSNDYSGDCASAGSIPHSSHSSKESSSQDQPPTPSAFANASKRILGSRLMRKNKVTKSGPTQGDRSVSGGVVEIDLHSLDLPDNTEILSNAHIISKIRGRKEDKAADMVDQSKVYVCGYCDRRFKRQEHLKRHFRSLHTAEKPYDCSICDKKFSRADNLNQHLKVHKQEDEEREAAEAAAAAAGAPA